jgi:membrane protein DedA with SNARE-associated domain
MSGNVRLVRDDGCGIMAESSWGGADSVMTYLVAIGLPEFSTSTLTDLLDAWGYPLVALFIAIESSGIPFPGETMLVAAAVYAGAGHLSIAWVIVAASLGAITGDNLGYLAGRYGGRKLVERYGGYVRIKAHHLEYAERFFDRHGDKTVFFGRHLAVLRAWAAFLAGLNRMSWQKFTLYNAAGGILWSVLYGSIGYFLGNNLSLMHRVISGLGIVGALITVVLVVAVFVYWRRSRKAGTTNAASPPSTER